MKLRKFFKFKRENLIIVFLSGQIFYVRLSMIVSTLFNLIHFPKYDFTVN